MLMCSEHDVTLKNNFSGIEKNIVQTKLKKNLSLKSVVCVLLRFF